LQNRFVVGGYVAPACGVANIHWVEELLHWQRGNSRRVREHPRVIYIIHQFHHRLTEKIGPPLIILVSDFQRLLGEHPQIHPRSLDLFSSYTEKATQKY
jgi:hypothetical protein